MLSVPFPHNAVPAPKRQDMHHRMHGARRNMSARARTARSRLLIQQKARRPCTAATAMMMHAASICGTGRKLPTSSTSPQGNNDNNYSQQYSDVALWLSTPGYVDYIMPQVYWGYNYTLQNGSARFAFENIVDEWLAMPRDDSVSLAFGLGAYRIGAGDGSATESGEWASGHNLADMARTLSVRGADGYALYRYASLYSGGEYAALMQAECAALAQANGIGQTEP